MKPLRFLGSSLGDVRRFPKPARRTAGFELFAVQRGLPPSDWKPLPSVGVGAAEIRVHLGGAWRVIYVARFAEAVFVLHAFEKKSRRTRNSDIELAIVRYKSIGGLK